MFTLHISNYCALIFFAAEGASALSPLPGAFPGTMNDRFAFEAFTMIHYIGIAGET